MNKIILNKTIRPTQLQPQLYAVIKNIYKGDDYKVIVNKDNQPLCVMISYNLFENADFSFFKKNKEKKLIKQVKDYYSNLSSDEKELLDEAIGDGI